MYTHASTSIYTRFSFPSNLQFMQCIFFDFHDCFIEQVYFTVKMEDQLKLFFALNHFSISRSSQTSLEIRSAHFMEAYQSRDIHGIRSHASHYPHRSAHTQWWKKPSGKRILVFTSMSQESASALPIAATITETAQACREKVDRQSLGVDSSSSRSSAAATTAAARQKTACYNSDQMLLNSPRPDFHYILIKWVGRWMMLLSTTAFRVWAAHRVYGTLV